MLVNTSKHIESIETAVRGACYLGIYLALLGCLKMQLHVSGAGMKLVQLLLECRHLLTKCSFLQHGMITTIRQATSMAQSCRVPSFSSCTVMQLYITNNGWHISSNKQSSDDQLHFSKDAAVLLKIPQEFSA